MKHYGVELTIYSTKQQLYYGVLMTTLLSYILRTIVDVCPGYTCTSHMHRTTSRGTEIDTMNPQQVKD